MLHGPEDLNSNPQHSYTKLGVTELAITLALVRGRGRRIYFLGFIATSLAPDSMRDLVSIRWRVIEFTMFSGF